MDINIFLLCYNEQILLPHTVAHYKHWLPSCNITIYDNESTDDSVTIAKKLGCNVISWSSNNQIDNFINRDVKNNCWKSIEKGWIIMADMDEWICVTEQQLIEEQNTGTSILQIIGADMIGESNTLDLSDINLHEICKYVHNGWENKSLCFLREKITEMNYTVGAHNDYPVGEIKISEKYYVNKHMDWLGLPFSINKQKSRYMRASYMRKNNLSYHYMNDEEQIKKNYFNKLNNCEILG